MSTYEIVTDGEFYALRRRAWYWWGWRYLCVTSVTNELINAQDWRSKRDRLFTRCWTTNRLLLVRWRRRLGGV